MLSYHTSIATVILLSLGCFCIDTGVIYATEGAKITSSETQNRTPNNGKDTKENTTKNEIPQPVEDSKNIIKLKQDIDESIVDFIVVPKAKQLIKDISIKFTEQYPKGEDRIVAYETIKKRLILRKNRIEMLKMSDKGKYILQEFLNQMIELLDKKIEDLG